MNGKYNIQLANQRRALGRGTKRDLGESSHWAAELGAWKGALEDPDTWEEDLGTWKAVLGDRGT